MSLLTGKRLLISGVASDRSIATGIAEALYAQGAECAFTYLNDKLKVRVEKVAERCGSSLLFPCDVNSDSQIEALFKNLSRQWPTFDGFVHAIAFAPDDQLDGDYLESVTREGFRIVHDVSSYSFAAMAKAAKPFLNPGSSLITLSYLGAERSIPNYNVMGLAKASLEANVRFMAASLGKHDIRVNAISAGPIRTLAAAGIANFKTILHQFELSAPLKRCVTIDEVGNIAAFMVRKFNRPLLGFLTMNRGDKDPHAMRSEAR